MGHFSENCLAFNSNPQNMWQPVIAEAIRKCVTDQEYISSLHRVQSLRIFSLYFLNYVSNENTISMERFGEVGHTALIFQFYPTLESTYEVDSLLFAPALQKVPSI